jgi:hypothetical protein
MAPIRPTRTIGPLHLEDLEPHRFEDLVRQLSYDFRDWLRLEGTGRTGSDDGFDVRGVEAASGAVRDDEEEDADQDASPLTGGRVWLIQCKREKAIAARKIAAYMDALKPAIREGVYGIIFAAACEFSKSTRDVFFAKAREFGLSEAHVWGKAEIEDMLFQPRNDHLLFAYTGISLLSRRRTIKTEVRSRLSAKRKAKRILQKGQNVLIRDASDDRYPHLDPDETKDRPERGRWRVFGFVGFFHDGLRFCVRRHFAWIGADGIAWDLAETMNDAIPHGHTDPWKNHNEDRYTSRGRAMQFWDALPEGEKAWFSCEAVLPYENIIDIDENGDDWVEQPHIYTTEFVPERGPFSGFYQELRAAGHFETRYAEPNPDTRVQKFPTADDDDLSKQRDGIAIPDDDGAG